MGTVLLSKKKFLCRIGFHQTFIDHVGQNVGSEEYPFYVFTTYYSCNYCDFSERSLR